MQDQQHREQSSLKSLIRSTWESSRLVAVHLYKSNTTIKQGYRNKLKPKDLWGLSWDVEETNMVHPAQIAAVLTNLKGVKVKKGGIHKPVPNIDLKHLE